MLRQVLLCSSESQNKRRPVSAGRPGAKQMIRQTQKYTTPRRQSSGRGEMFRAVLLVREATRLLKTKAILLPDSAPGTRLQKIATGLGDFSSSLERAAVAIERGHHRKLHRTSTGEVSGDLEMNLSQLEAELSHKLHCIPIGSRQARQLYQSRERVRGLLAPVADALP